MLKTTPLLRLSAGSLGLALALASPLSATAADTGVAASVAVSNMNLWRGYDLGQGEAAVSGDLQLQAYGFYTGIWAGSGDAEWGTEYDLYMGYATEIKGVGIDFSLWNYVYPGIKHHEAIEGDASLGRFDDLGAYSDAVLSLSYAGFTASVYDNIAGMSGYEYYSLSYQYKSFGILVGRHDNETGDREDRMVHLDLSYAHNDNLTFTLSQQVDKKSDDSGLKAVVEYRLQFDN